jgi:hypothetical protein
VSSFGIALSPWLLACFRVAAMMIPPPACIAVRGMASMPMIATRVFTRPRHDRPPRHPVETPETAI